MRFITSTQWLINDLVYGPVIKHRKWDCCIQTHRANVNHFACGRRHRNWKENGTKIKEPKKTL